MTKTLMSGVRIALAISAVSLAASGANGQTAPNAKPVTATVNSALQWGPCPPDLPGRMPDRRSERRPRQA